MSIKDLNIEPENNIYFIPEVRLIQKTGICLISGESYIEEAPKFYDKIIAWVHDYFELGNKGITFNFKLQYFNTSSSRCIASLMKVLAKYHHQGKNVNINWYCGKDDDDLVEEAEDFQKEIGMSINIIIK